MLHYVYFSSGPLRLEASLCMSSQAQGGIVLFHPHPLYGGNMDNAVLQAIARELETRGLATMSFNFRGVGASEGNYSGGDGEEEDGMAAVDFFSSRLGKGHRFLGVCGYSFGGMIALRVAARHPAVAAVAAVAPAVGPTDTFAGLRRPKLLVVGTRDELVDPAALEGLVQQMPEPKELVLLPGADHFLVGFKRRVAVIIGRFFAHLYDSHISSCQEQPT
jgi:alpha/beta superfamily hydrolase